ncbi:MAG: hypothetical protein WCT35_02865 [Sideroxydans sp.]
MKSALIAVLVALSLVACGKTEVAAPAVAEAASGVAAAAPAVTEAASGVAAAAAAVGEAAKK